ncbi:DUF6888 family protein [Oscillatoria salina]|uniref:DUF6888 family protein n=1 Tax=Oscillatoria salina TaxID=331517 RepID=UPI001CCE6077|nr:hypothetical protein [Oscillatoria salina]MBZ8179211.1 hypothetical protein [Oscillatoria salina IIICB1]
MPTAAQAIQAAILCQWLSNGYQPINIFRYDAKIKTLYLQAGTTDDIALIVFPDGSWSFV